MAEEQYTSKYTRKEIETNIDEIKTRVGTVEGNTSGLGDLANRVGALESWQPGIQTGVENAQKGVQGVQGELRGVQNGLQSRVIALEGWQSVVHPKIEGLQTNVSALKEWQTGIQTGVENAQKSIQGVQSEAKGRIDSLVGTQSDLLEFQGYLWGKQGRTRIIAGSNNVYTLSSDFRFNVVEIRAASTLTLNSTNLADGQELYVFILGQFPFKVNIENVLDEDHLYIINPDGEKIVNNTTEIDSTPAGFREMSIIKSSIYVFVRIA